MNHWGRTIEPVHKPTHKVQPGYGLSTSSDVLRHITAKYNCVPTQLGAVQALCVHTCPLLLAWPMAMVISNLSRCHLNPTDTEWTCRMTGMAAFRCQLLAKRRDDWSDRRFHCPFTSELQHATSAQLIRLFEECFQDLCTGSWNWQEEGYVNPYGHGEHCYMFTDNDSLFERWDRKREGKTCTHAEL